MSGAPQGSAEERVQEDLLRLDAYRNQLNAMVQQFQLLSSSRADHARARESLAGLDGADDATEVLVPIGGDVLLRARPVREAKVFLGVGSGIVTELASPKVAEVLAERIKRIDDAAQELEGQIRTLEERIQRLAQRIDAISRGEEHAHGPDSTTDDVGRD